MLQLLRAACYGSTLLRSPDLPVQVVALAEADLDCDRTGGTD
jgi:hypothetical protein